METLRKPGGYETTVWVDVSIRILAVRLTQCVEFNTVSENMPGKIMGVEVKRWCSLLSLYQYSSHW